MYRLKYYSLSKEEKDKLKKDFYETNLGKEIKLRMTRLLIIGILGILFSIYLFIVATNKWNYVYASILAITSLFFLYESYNVRINKMNEYLVNIKKKHK